MSASNDNRRLLKRAFRQQERERERRGLPLPVTEMGALFDYLAENLPEAGCDDTLRLTEEFLRTHQLEAAPVIAWLHNHGGYCDCEVLANTEDDFRGLAGE